MATPCRPLHSTPGTFLPRKDTQDKDSLNPSSNEYSKSGSDDASASSDAAFDPSQTSPESEKKISDQESENASKGGPSSLDVSPGNPEVSQPRGQQEGGAQRAQGEGKEGEDRARRSGGGSAPKAGGGKSG
ncbi:hypothetical protein K432DRAFT_296693 [Lepidopterella palustris CBS 459.81]|uniref:Uncharacterized protein n=1 Tax=Lepidopterella palustris CBS 459.81 TaxID=1314670 RepID=A0A8E2EBI1_9PEZI|nr:hypothetical protein K432DRAFT_296693 [Lepidopterella palustris CBS 459.81]